jgi:hypothetical protein
MSAGSDCGKATRARPKVHDDPTKAPRGLVQQTAHDSPHALGDNAI